MQSRNDKDMIGDMAEQTRFFRTCVGVFQGGGCRGAALAGAYQEAVARGVTFAGTSAGSIVAALIGAGATPEYVSNVLVNLSFKSLLTPSEALCNRPLFAHLLSWLPGLRLALALYYDRGLYSAKGIEIWVEERLRELLPRAARPAVTFEDLIIPTSIITDTATQKVEVRSRVHMIRNPSLGQFVLPSQYPCSFNLLTTAMLTAVS